MDKLYEGKVIFFDNKAGFGFIKWEGEKDMFVHFSGIISENDEFRTLKKGQSVQFNIGKNVREQDVAVNVKVVG